MTGKELFELYVRVGLATANAYRWDQLSNAMQERWNAMAQIIGRHYTGI